VEVKFSDEAAVSRWSQMLLEEMHNQVNPVPQPAGLDRKRQRRDVPRYGTAYPTRSFAGTDSHHGSKSLWWIAS
jgi:hypothetical protein